MTSIEKVRDIKGQINFCNSFIQKSVGKKFTDEFGWVNDTYNDKHGCEMSIYEHHTSPPLYFNCYYGFYGDSNVSVLSNEFYMKCLCEAINKNFDEILKDTEQIMRDKYKKALESAKKEAEEIINECNKY